MPGLELVEMKLFTCSFQVDFDTRKIITAIAIQNYYRNYDIYIKKFQLMYTEDSYVWKKYLEIGFIEVGTVRVAQLATQI